MNKSRVTPSAAQYNAATATATTINTLDLARETPFYLRVEDDLVLVTSHSAPPLQNTISKTIDQDIFQVLQNF